MVTEITREDFDRNYDKIMPTICKPYHEFLAIAANAVPKDVRRVYDLGVGTGNLSAEVRSLLPKVEIYGIDTDWHSLDIARAKVSGLRTFNEDIFTTSFHEEDYVVSSLAIHNLGTDIRREKLTEIARSARGFINFDLVLFDGKTLEDAIELIQSFAGRSYGVETLEAIRSEMRANDNPMSLREQRDLFESLGMEFKILDEEEPYVVYSVRNE